MFTRRRFLTASSLALTGDLLTPSFRGLWAASSSPTTRVVTVPTHSAAPVSHFFEPIADPATMRTAATAAIDAAMHAGAEWADIRLGDRRTYGGFDNTVTYSFGLRARVGGAEAFVGGGDPTTDRLVQAARSAVATARGLSTVGECPANSAHGLTPVPAATGEWRAPMEIDPFAVSIDEHDHVGQTLNGLDDVRLSQLGVGRSFMYSVEAETRVNASSDGTLVTQCLGGVVISENTVRTSNWRLRHPGEGEQVRIPFPGYRSATAGFEVIARQTRFAQIEQAAHELRRYEALPYGTVDVGRYNVIFDGATHAGLLQAALVPMLSLRRVLGYDADIGGTSPWGPIEDMMGQPLFSPLLSLQIECAPPALGACRWDAEGVTAVGGPLITNGTLVNYITTRATHALLASRLAAMRRAGKGMALSTPLLGSTTAALAFNQPAEYPMAVSMPAAVTGGTVDELAKQMGTGLVVLGGDTDVNPEGTGGRTYPMLMLEVKGGKLVRRLYGASLQFSTQKIFKSLKALGETSTVAERTGQQWMGFPEHRWRNSLTAPAALYTGVDVLNNL